MTALRRLDWRLVPIQIGALVAFLLLPVWYRFTVREAPPLLLSRQYVSYFLLLLPLLWTVGWWLVLGLPGFRALLRDPPRRAWALLVLLLALWAYGSLTWAFMRDLHPEVGASAALQLAVVLLFAVTVACAGPPPRAVIAMLAVGLAFNAVVTILQASTQSPLGLHRFGEFPVSPTMPSVSVVVAGALRWVRPYGLMPHPNALAGTLIVGLLASAALLLSRRAVARWIAVVVLPLGAWALLLTFSRAAWVGAAAGVFALLPPALGLIRRRLNPQMLVAAALIAVVGSAFVVNYRPLLSARVGEGTESVELRSISDRLVFNDFAARSIAQTPILGVGVGNFPWRTSYFLTATNYDLRGDNVHQVMLSAWAELGVVGLALLVGALVAGIEAALRQLKAGHAATLDSAVARNVGPRVALLAVVMALIVIGLLDHYPWTMLHLQVAWWGCLATAMRPTHDV